MNHPHIRPLGRRVLIKVQPREYNGKVHIPEGFLREDKILHGEVLDIGPKCEEFTGAVGDIVALNDYSGNTIKLQGEEYKDLLLIDERNLLGVICQKNTKGCGTSSLVPA